MFAKALTPAALAVLASHLVAAQTFTDCNPMEKTCPADPGIGKSGINCDFTKGECGDFTPLPYTTVSYDDKGALFSISNGKQAPTISTPKFMFFGKLEVELQATHGQGVVTSVVLQSKDLDEIDWEWVGGDNAQVQSNYFGKGDTTTYDRAAYHPVDAPLTSFHTYTIEWTKKAITWAIDGAVVRTLTYEEAKGGSRFPQTPMEVKIGTWVAGLPDGEEGTVEWAGGYTDFNEAPFEAWYKSVSVTDYAGGDGPTKDSVKEYVWGDKTGSWESIKVVKGDGSDDSDDDETTTTAKPTKTQEQTTTKETEASTTTADDSEETTSAEVTSTVSSAVSTITTVTTPGASTSESASPTESGSDSEDPSTTDAPPAEVSDDSAAGKLAFSLGGAAFAGVAVLLGQLL
ncbi:hypothetical protein N3K66_008852 [Trichothecium roseum]|uniref:Uncharacterized protein n=1 Tax=Trichothecium roseum TaxID=47278 RepID=A0ACC0URJ0_9HYPO|nr:hypothetical protein N3K66_008852 [Trichothecium roseum]